MVRPPQPKLVSPPRLPRWLGLAGLLPQLAAVAVLLSGDLHHHYNALALAYAYAALILSFLGGMWWGIAARTVRPPVWLWIAAVAPTLLALATAVPWAVGWSWPGPSLGVLGVALIAALAVDWQLYQLKQVPHWWMPLRVPLSLGLGILTLIAALA